MPTPHVREKYQLVNPMVNTATTATHRQNQLECVCLTLSQTHVKTIAMNGSRIAR